MNQEAVVVAVERAIAAEWERWSVNEGADDNLGDIPRAFLAVAAVAAFERHTAEAQRVSDAERNIAYLRANIAEMDRFIRQADDDDPIGQMQWISRKADFERQLAAALATA